MTRILIILSLMTSMSLLQSCGDIIESRHHIHGLYFVSKDSGNLTPTLYYDLGNGNAIGRVSDINAAGHIGDLIIVETKKGFYFFDSQLDNQYLNGSEIIGKLKTKNEFFNLLNSLQSPNFEFDYK